eukprot:939771-Rhodomonas_salina.1
MSHAGARSLSRAHHPASHCRASVCAYSCTPPYTCICIHAFQELGSSETLRRRCLCVSKFAALTLESGCGTQGAAAAAAALREREGASERGMERGRERET